MSDQTNSGVSLRSVGVIASIGVVGTLLGTIASGMLALHMLKGERAQDRLRTTARGTQNYEATVTLYDGNKCRQTMGNIRFAYPVLRPRHGATAGDTICWQGRDGRKGSSGGPLSIDVEFSPPPAVTPFVSYSFPAPAGACTSTSGEPIGSASDYDYLSVTVDGVLCKSWDPGVHVDQ